MMRVQIPTDWTEVSLRTFIAYQKALRAPTDVLRIARVVECFTGLSRPQVVQQMPWADVVKVYTSLAPLLSSRPDYKVQERLKVGGRAFGFHPHLLNMTTGEFIDLSNLDGGFWMSADKAMAILYRPIVEDWGRKYRIEPYRSDHLDNADLFLDVDMGTVFGAGAFFLTLTDQLGLIIPTYLSRVAKRMEREAAHSLKETLRELRGTNSSSASPTKTP